MSVEQRYSACMQINFRIIQNYMPIQFMFWVAGNWGEERSFLVNAKFSDIFQKSFVEYYQHT